MQIDMERVAALCRVSIAVSVHRRDWLEASLDACGSLPGLLPEHVAEAILQGIPYSGFPGAGEALALWRERREAGPGSALEDTSRAAGERIFAQVYGDVSDRVRSQLRRRHPQLEQWILEFAYGSVMGRGILDLAEVEALGVASLLAQERRSPLRSHLRGALRTGWSEAQLDDLLGRLQAWCDPDILMFARETIGRQS